MSTRAKRIAIAVAATGCIAAVATVGAVGWLWTAAVVDTSGEIAFERELRIPPLLDPRDDGSGGKLFELEVRPGEAELLPGKRTATWGVNGDYLGPTLRATRGDRVRIAMRNRLPEATTLHWHGMHLPAAADGGPHQMVAPGDDWRPSWQIDQPAATLWYHPHPHGRTAEHVYRGVAGMFILDDPPGTGPELPDDYGVDDIPVILQDKRFEDDGELDMSGPPISPVGIVGPDVLVNGTHGPYVELSRDRVRLRLLNASNGRVYRVGLADGRPFELIASDGGLLDAPARMDRVQLSPGERAEIAVELEPGERTVLRSYPPRLGANFFERRFSGGDDTLDLLQLRAADRLDRVPPVPRDLTPTPPVDPPLRERDASAARHFELNGRNINGRKMDMDRIDAAVPLDATEVWSVENGGGTPHSFHVHDVQFRVLAVDGDPPPAALSGPKDTVYVPPGSTLRLLIRFTDYSDPDVPYMFHCHVLDHEDSGMMGQFTVARDGERRSTPPGGGEHHH